jgi:hypothetical protein
MNQVFCALPGVFASVEMVIGAKIMRIVETALYRNALCQRPFCGMKRIVSNSIFLFGPNRIIREVAAFLCLAVMEMHSPFDFLIKQTLPGVAQTLIAFLFGRIVVAVETQE